MKRIGQCLRSSRSILSLQLLLYGSGLLRVYGNCYAWKSQDAVKFKGKCCMENRKKGLKKRLIERAKNLAAAGFSVIPVHGNGSPREPKKPARRWKAFQIRIASEAEIEGSFNDGVTALGIVCGRVSKLLVIDFDDHLRYQRYCRHLPQYSKTYTVKTRRGYHLYFRTAEKVPSHQFDGGDIKAEKSYVIGPPSLIGDFVYQCVNDVAVQELEKSDLDRILNYFPCECICACCTGSGDQGREGCGYHQRVQAIDR